MTLATAPDAPEQAQSRFGRWGPRAFGLAILAVLATAAAMVAAGGAYEPSTPGLPDPGAIIGWGLPISRVLTDLAAAVTAAWLIGAAFLDPQDARARCLPWAARTSCVLSYPLRCGRFSPSSRWCSPSATFSVCR